MRVVLLFVTLACFTTLTLAGPGRGFGRDAVQPGPGGDNTLEGGQSCSPDQLQACKEEIRGQYFRIIFLHAFCQGISEVFLKMTKYYLPRCHGGLPEADLPAHIGGDLCLSGGSPQHVPVQGLCLCYPALPL